MRLIRFADYFFVLRPVLFFPAWTTTLAGYLAVTGKTVPRLTFVEWWNPGMTWICASSAMIMGAGFIINQLEDTESDRINAKLFFLSEAGMSRKAAVSESIALLFSGLLIGVLLSFDLFILYLMAVLFFMIGYNFRPFLWKNGVWGSTLANAGMGAFAFAFGWIMVPLSVFDFVYDVLPYLFYNTALYFLTTIPDIEGDSRTGKQTMAVAYGVRATVFVSTGCFAAGIMSSVLGQDMNMLLPSLLLLPFYVTLIIRQTRERVIRTVKFGLFFFALMIGFYFPLYLVLIVIFFFVTRIYYKKRFNMIYPNFKGS